MKETKITKEEALFFLDSVNSMYGPTYKPKIGQSKAYYQFLKNPNSEDYTTFIRVYQHFRENLKERDKTILDLIYGINGDILTLNKIGQCLEISNSRVSQLRSKAERLLAKKIHEYLYGRKNTKQCFSSIISSQPDEILFSIGQATRSWDRIIKHYFDQEQPRYYKRRQKLEHALFRMWMINGLDHREQAIKLLNIKANDVY